MTREQAIEFARETGFSHWGIFSADQLRFLPEVRAACETNKCHRYGQSWSCPPACGSLEECREKAMEFQWGLLLQTTGTLEDSFDVEAMMDTEQKHRELFNSFCMNLDSEDPHLPLGAGTCTLCKECTYPDAPCRFPGKMCSSMEAFGLLVTEVCQSAGISYYYGPCTITYSACVLFKDL